MDMVVIDIPLLASPWGVSERPGLHAIEEDMAAIDATPCSRMTKPRSTVLRTRLLPRGSVSAIVTWPTPEEGMPNHLPLEKGGSPRRPLHADAALALNDLPAWNRHPCTRPYLCLSAGA